LNVTATDADENDILLFSIQNAIPDIPFNINQNNGMLYTIRNIDYELHSSYTFDIVVNDKSGNLVSLTGYTKIIITVTDENDNHPMFTTNSGSTSISEGVKVGQMVYQLSATDKDSGANGNIIYEIISGNTGESFKVENQNDIVIKNSLDRETVNKYHLEIKATDNGLKLPNTINYSMFNLTIDVIDENDNQPAFTKDLYEVNLKENTPVDSLVLQVQANDVDEKSILSYGIENTIAQKYFYISSNNGSIYTKVVIDYEKVTSVTIIVTASDSGSSVLKSKSTAYITITDENDNKPTFATNSEITSISEGANVGQIVYQLSATDNDAGSNGEIMYEIISGNSGTSFVIENQKDITVKKGLDRETVNQYHLEIKATDNGPKLPNTTIFSMFNLTIDVIDENDNQPAFLKDLYEVNLNENTPVNTLVLQVQANDVDKASTLTYGIENAIAKNYFYISSTNGSIYTKVIIDFEKVTSVTIIITASDSGTSVLKSKSTAVIAIVDEDDNLPVFSEGESTTSVFMNAILGSEVAVIKATDADSSPNNIIYYEVLTATDFFVINAISGSLTLAKLLKKSDPSQFILQIVAKPNLNVVGASVPNVSKFTLNITIKPPINNNPVFSAQSYLEEIDENLVTGTSVLTVSATTALASAVQYTIMESTYTLPFIINSTSGVLSVSSAIDYEKYQRHKFYVKSEVVAEPLESSIVLVNVIVANLNDNRPIFLDSFITTSVSEKALIGHMVYKVQATDDDKTHFNNVQYVFERTPPVNPFSLNETTGEVYVAKDLDYETTTRYNISISANDRSGLSSTENATVIINILDVDEIVRSSFSKDEIAITIITIFFIIALVVILFLILVLKRNSK